MPPIPRHRLPRRAAGPSRLLAALALVLLAGTGLGIVAGYLLWFGRAPAPGQEPGQAAHRPTPPEGADAVPSPTAPPDAEVEPGPDAEDMPPVDPIEEEFDLWPARHLFISLKGPRLTDAERALLRDLKPGGVVLTRENIENADQTRALVDSIKEATGLGKSLFDLPLICIDQEGGAVNRLKLADAPSARELGALADMEAARQVAARYAEACRERGIAVVLAPVLDVYEEGGHERFASRSFGTDSRKVAALGLAFADGLMMNGVLAVAKHFPGHGATRQDSHETLAVLPKGKEGLSRLMYPFYEAVHCGVPGIMPGHIAVPALNPEHPKRPASLSELMLRGFLRERWGYDGVIVSDDLAMQAIAAMYPMEEAVVAALRAGNDAVIVFENDPDRVRAMARAIEESVSAGALERTELVQSLNRLEQWQLWLREPRGLRRPLPPLPESAPAAMADAGDATDREAATEEAAPEADIRPGTRGRTHEVEAGDSLAALARRYDTTVEQLVAWNGLDGTTIQPGQSLAVAPPENTPMAAESGPEAPEPIETVVHEVQPGESLSRIAQRYGVAVQALLDLNEMERDDVLFVGKKLRVPTTGAESPTQ